MVVKVKYDRCMNYKGLTYVDLQREGSNRLERSRGRVV
jgi:hypothetical protein